MEIVKIVLEFTKVLVWPVIVIILVFKFRAPIAKLLLRLTKASGYGFNFELDAQGLTHEEQTFRLKAEVKEVATSLSQDGELTTTTTQPENLPSTIELARTLALKEIATVYKGNLRRDVKLYDYPFDAVIWASRGVIGVEIKLTAAQALPSSQIMQLFRNAERVAAEYASNVFVYVIVIVTLNQSAEARAQIRDSVVKLANVAAVAVDVRVFDFAMLKDRYGLTTKS